MKVLEFAFADDEKNAFLPHNYTTNCVVYTGTHDNDTVLGWYAQAKGWEKKHCDQYLGIHDGDEVNWKFIDAVYASVADYAIVQMQDVLGLGSEARINVPSTLGGNWAWRIDKHASTKEIAARLKKLAIKYNRI